MYPARIKLFRENFENALPTAGFNHIDTGTIIAGALKYLDDNTRLTNDFFDIARIVKNLGAKYRKSPDEVKRMIVLRPGLIFEVNGLNSQSNEAQSHNPSSKRVFLPAEKESDTVWTGRKRRPKLVLPDDNALSKAAIQYFEQNKKWPYANSGSVEIDGKEYKWSTLIIRFRDEHDETLVSYAKKEMNMPQDSVTPEDDIDPEQINGENISVLTEEQSPVELATAVEPEAHTAIDPVIPKGDTVPSPIELTQVQDDTSHLVACNIFRDSATFIRKNKTLPDPKSYHHFLGGMSVADINRAFKKGTIAGLSELLPGQEPPKHVSDFLVATGLAERKGRELIPASPKKLDELVKALG